MNPFLHDPVAKPLAPRSTNGWLRVFSNRRSRTADVAAGFSMAFTVQATDVNTASVTELQTLRGLGPRTAQMIVQERDRAGKFESLQDLSDRVKGLGQKRLQSLLGAGLVVGSAESSIDQVGLKSSKQGSRSPQAAAAFHQARATPMVQALP